MTRLFFYYAYHSFVNSIKKLFRTWVAIIIAVSLFIGLLFGIGAGVVIGFIEDSTEENPDSGYTEEYAEDEEVYEEMTEEERLLMKDILEIAAGGVILLMILSGIWTADKSGTSIFTLADVNMLFPSPNKPQSVLMYKTVMQAGLVLAGSLYLLFQLPNLILNIGMSISAALMLILAWILTLILMKLISVFCYTYNATHGGTGRALRVTVISVVVLVSVIYAAVWKIGCFGSLEAAVILFGSGASRYVPVWGWLKGMILYAYEGRWLAASLCTVGVLAAFVLFVWLIWNMRVDFYEDALNSAAARDEKLRAAAEGKRSASAKPRSERIKRDKEFKYGFGASVFFTKTLYNRLRFTPGGIFTKTAVLYIMTASAVSCFVKFVIGAGSAVPAAAVLAFMIIFASLGNPLAEETSKNYIFIIPDRAFKKVFYCALSGSVNCFFNVLPALIIAECILLDNILTVLLLVLLLTSLDFFVSSAGTFIGLAMPSSLNKAIVSVFQMSSAFTAAVPTVILAAVGLAFSVFPICIAAAAAVNIAVGMIFTAVSSTFISEGVK